MADCHSCVGSEGAQKAELLGGEGQSMRAGEDYGAQGSLVGHQGDDNQGPLVLKEGQGFEFFRDKGRLGEDKGSLALGNGLGQGWGEVPKVYFQALGLISPGPVSSQDSQAFFFPVQQGDNGQ